MKLTPLGLLLTVAFTATVGCTRLHELEADFVNHLRASDAWRHEPSTGPRGFERPFKKGWKKGFYDVASGEDGQPPVLPPNEYWGIGYRNPRGQESIQAWFDGYRAGAAAAESMGVRDWSYVATEPPVMIGPLDALEGPIVDAPAEEVPPPETGGKPQSLPPPPVPLSGSKPKQ